MKMYVFVDTWIKFCSCIKTHLLSTQCIQSVHNVLILKKVIWQLANPHCWCDHTNNDSLVATQAMICNDKGRFVKIYSLKMTICSKLIEHCKCAIVWLPSLYTYICTHYNCSPLTQTICNPFIKSFPLYTQEIWWATWFCILLNCTQLSHVLVQLCNIASSNSAIVSVAVLKSYG